MPWCEACSRFWTQPSMTPAGECPQCGAELKNPAGIDRVGVEDTRAPWHFKLLVAAVVLYLGWRLVQILGWVVG